MGGHSLTHTHTHARMCTHTHTHILNSSSRINTGNKLTRCCSWTSQLVAIRSRVLLDHWHTHAHTHAHTRTHTHMQEQNSTSLSVLLAYWHTHVHACARGHAPSWCHSWSPPRDGTAIPAPAAGCHASDVPDSTTEASCCWRCPPHRRVSRTASGWPRRSWHGPEGHLEAPEDGKIRSILHVEWDINADWPSERLPLATG